MDTELLIQPKPGTLSAWAWAATQGVGAEPSPAFIAATMVVSGQAFGDLFDLIPAAV